MKPIFAFATVALGLLAFGCSKPHTADSAKVQGNWTGKESGADTPGTPTLALQGSSLEFHGADTNEWYKGTFTIHENTTLKQMDVVITECPAPQYVGKTAHAIYELTGDSLTISANEPGSPNLPANIGAPGSRTMVFKRN